MSMRWFATYHLRSALLALCGLLLAPTLLSACGTARRHDPPLAQGWKWYHDPRYSFQIPVPPGWSAAAWLNTSPPAGDCEYIVDLFPPGVHPSDMRGIAEQEPRMMSVMLTLNCSPTDISNDNAGSVHWVAEPTHITISGQSTVVYDRVNDAAPSTPGAERVVIANFGGHQYSFGLQSDVFTPYEHDESAQDLPLYTYLLQHFLYTGPNTAETTVPG